MKLSPELIYKTLKKVVKNRVFSDFHVPPEDIIIECWLKMYDSDFENEVHMFRTAHIIVKQWLWLNHFKFKARNMKFEKLDQNELEASYNYNNVTEYINKKDNNTQLKELLKQLTPVDRVIIEAKYDLMTELETPTNNEIAQYLFNNGYTTKLLSREAIRLRILKIMKKISLKRPGLK